LPQRELTLMAPTCIQEIGTAAEDSGAAQNKTVRSLRNSLAEQIFSAGGFDEFF
jgi:hypothetical protein